LMATMAAAGLFLRQTFVIGALGFVIGLIGTLSMTVPDFVPVPDLAVRGILWLWSVFALGLAGAVAANLLIARKDPEAVLREELVARVHAAEDAIGRRLGTRSAESSARELARAGIAGIVPVLGELEHVAGLMRQALGPDGAVVDVPPAGATGLFVPDALTNPAYVRYALKGTLAVMICYVLQSAVDWPGIRTCIVTCLI